MNLLSVGVLALLFAQAAPRGVTVGGLAQDQTGAVLPGAAVTLSASGAAGRTQQVTTDQNGAFRFEQVLPGEYDIRAEFQGLFTKQDEGSWAMALAEYTISPHWFFALIDQYNYGNEDAEKQIHYFSGSFGYTRNATRISLGYGKQREGYLCVGGVCRLIPASYGVSLSVTSSF